ALPHHAPSHVMPSDLSCRLASIADIPAVLDMMRDFNRGEGITIDTPRLRLATATLMADASLGVLPVFEADHRLAGYPVVTWGFDLEYAGRDAYLTELYLLPELRGRGLGADMLAHVVRLARSHHAHALHLGVKRDNAPALKLYQQAGFRDWTRRIMTLDLGA